jgi:uncharacterized glyoxalase superfamily protein PhnB
MPEDDSWLVLPVLGYVDPDAALPWLCRVFGFSEASRMTRRDGRIAIADVRTSTGGHLMINGIQGPSEVARPDSVTVIVPDADAQFEHVRREGARIAQEPTDQPWGLRDFEAVDLEGRRWNFSQHLA